MKKKRLAIILVCLMLIVLPSFCLTASANGFGHIEVRVTLLTFIPLRTAKVTGENVLTHEIYEGYYDKNGIYYINIPYDFPMPEKKTINVKVSTNILGSQNETVFDLMETELVHLDFNFGWGFPLLTKLLQYIFP